MPNITATFAPADDPSCSVTLRCAPEKNRDARKFVAQALTGWGLEHLGESATLAVSELFTNTLEHAPCRYVRIVVSRVHPQLIRVAVVDRSPASTPAPRSADEADEHGRGLALVEALAEKWGVERMEWGKRVWCELACHC